MSGNFTVLTIPPGLEPCEIFRLAIFGVILGVINWIGIIGNFIGITALLFEKSKNKTTYMLLGLQISDTIFLLVQFFALSFYSLAKYIPKVLGKPSVADTKMVIEGVVKYPSPFATGCYTASNYHIMLITFERFIAVCYPHYANKITTKRTLIVQAVIYIISLGLNATRMFEYNAVYFPLYNIWIVQAAKLKVNPYYTSFVTFQFWAIGLIIPTLSLTIMTAFIIQGMKKTTRSYKKGLTISMVIINVINLSQQLVNGSRRIYVATVDQEVLVKCDHPYFYVYGAVNIYISFNFATNFFILVAYNTHFKKQIQKLKNVLRKPGNKVESNETSITNTTKE